VVPASARGGRLAARRQGRRHAALGVAADLEDAHLWPKTRPARRASSGMPLAILRAQCGSSSPVSPAWLAATWPSISCGTPGRRGLRDVPLAFADGEPRAAPPGPEVDIVEGRYSDGQGLRDEKKKGRVTLLYCELTDAGAVEHLISAIQPERIFHLAAQSFVQESFDEPASTLHINIQSQVNLLESVRRHGKQIRVHVRPDRARRRAGPPDEVPMKETNPLRPLSPYAGEQGGAGQARVPVLQVLRSPRRGDERVQSHRAAPRAGVRRQHVREQIAEIEAGFHPPVIYHGDLTSKRDLSDVRDIVRAYWLALEKAEARRELQRRSGRTHTIREMLDVLLGYSKLKIRTEEDPPGCGERRADPVGRSDEVPRRDRLGAEDPVRADPARRP